MRLDDTEGHAETLGFGVNTVEGKPIKLEVVRNQDLTFVMLRPWTDEDDKAAGDKK